MVKGKLLLLIFVVFVSCGNKDSNKIISDLSVYYDGQISCSKGWVTSSKEKSKYYEISIKNSRVIDQIHDKYNLLPFEKVITLVLKSDNSLLNKFDSIKINLNDKSKDFNIDDIKVLENYNLAILKLVNKINSGNKEELRHLFSQNKVEDINIENIINQSIQTLKNFGGVKELEFEYIKNVIFKNDTVTAVKSILICEKGKLNFTCFFNKQGNLVIYDFR